MSVYYSYSRNIRKYDFNSDSDIESVHWLTAFVWIFHVSPFPLDASVPLRLTALSLLCPHASAYITWPVVNKAFTYETSMWFENRFSLEEGEMGGLGEQVEAKEKCREAFCGLCLKTRCAHCLSFHRGALLTQAPRTPTPSANTHEIQVREFHLPHSPVPSHIWKSFTCQTFSDVSSTLGLLDLANTNYIWIYIWISETNNSFRASMS